MKTSLKKWKGFSLHHRHGVDQKEPRDLRSLAQLDELAQASQDMEDMRDCYDSLLSAAAATANSAYEFSESLREMGACLLQKTALSDDEESGRVLLMLGKVQFELQKLIDSYRSHIFQTITSPSESLLNELRIVEEMKLQCDEKRDIYENMLMTQRGKGRGKSGKGERFSLQQIQAAHDEYDEEATLFVFRLKSLKQGQSRSLLTQAARHHAAQLCFFRKALKSLEAVEPEVKSVTEEQHIDYHFRGLEDDDKDDGDDDTDDANDGELSFDYGQNDHEQEVSTSANLMELDHMDVTFPQVAALGPLKENVDRGYRHSFSFRRDIRAGSQSAPLFAENKSDPADKLKQMRTSLSRKFGTYVLPTPVDANGSNVRGTGNPAPPTSKSSLSSHRQNLWHSSPLDPKRSEKRSEDEKFTRFNVVNPQSVLRESNNNTAASTQLPPPLADGFFSPRLDPLAASDSKKIKRYAFSGPIASQPWPTKPISVKHPQLKSGPLLQTPVVQLSSSPKASPKVSPRVSRSPSPTFASSPKISELHELPRPPVNAASKSSRPLNLVGHSAPLMPKANVHPVISKPLVSNAASPLPTPSQVVTRSFSIPSSGLRGITSNVSQPFEATHSTLIEDVSSPPLTPISLSKNQ